MTPQELKNSILQLAIQGKLVEQRAEEGTANITSTIEVSELDVHDIPENWKWCSIKDVASINTGLSFKKQEQKDETSGDLRVLRGGNIGDDYQYHLYDNDVFVDFVQFEKKYIQLLEGDVITPSVTSIEKICKTGYIDNDLEKVTAGGFVYIIRSLDRNVMHPKYMQYFITSAFNKEQCKPNIHKSGQAFYNLKKTGFIAQPICIPPLEEQKRIVAKIEELLPYIDKYEKAWTKLEEFNKKFPDDMQKSILQMAIQGKLVEQRAEEGTAEELYEQIQAEKNKLVKEGKIKKQKALPDITEDEIPFDIPDSWKWVRLGDIVKSISAGGDKPKAFSKDKTDDLFIEVISNGETNKGIFGYTNTPTVTERSMTVSGRGTIGYTEIRTEPYVPIVRLLVILPLEKTHLEYLRICIQAFTEFGNGSAVKQLTVPMLTPKVVPLPPLEEQMRIVHKIEELLPICEHLKEE